MENPEKSANKNNRNPMFSDTTISLIRKRTAEIFLAASVALFSPQVLNASDEHSYAQEIQQDIAEDKVYLLENIRQNVTIPSEKTIVDALLTEDAPQAVMLFQKQLREYPDPALDQLSTSRIAAYNLALNRSTSSPKSSISSSSRKQRPAVVKADTTQQSSLPQLNDALPSAQRQHATVIKDSTKYSSKTRPNARRTAIIKTDSTRYSSRQRPKVTLPASEKSKEEKIVEGPATSTLQFGSFESRKNAEILAKKISYNAAVEIVQKGQTYKVKLKTHYRSSEEAEAAAKRLPVNSIVVPSK